MLQRLAHQATRFMWQPIEDPSELQNDPVLLTWEGAIGPAKHGLGVFKRDRKYDGENYGDGFVCWWSGKPLTDSMTHWAPPPLMPTSTPAAQHVRGATTS